MLSLVFTESSLELVPKELQSHNSVIAHCNKIGKKPSEILLDNSWHFAAMKKIKNENKRGRPDIIHFSLLEATSIPLYFQNKIKIYVHTIHNKVIFVGDNVRLPKSYHRFSGLIEQLFRDKIITSNSQNLLEIHEMTFNKLIDTIKPKKTIGLSTRGKTTNCQQIAKNLNKDSCLVIGGFQKGHFTNETTKKCDEIFSIDNLALESHIVTSRVLYEYEKTIFM